MKRCDVCLRRAHEPAVGEETDEEADGKGTESPQSLRSRLIKVNVFFGYS